MYIPIHTEKKHTVQKGNLESGSFSYLGNSVCKYIRNSAKFRGIPGKIYYKKYRGIPRNSAEFRVFFKKFRIPPEVKKALPWTPYLRVVNIILSKNPFNPKVTSYPIVASKLSATNGLNPITVTIFTFLHLKIRPIVHILHFIISFNTYF
jgi:hypothetical protein